MHILRDSYYAKLPLVFLRKVASHCRGQTGPFPLLKRQPVQTVNHGSEGGFWGGRQFAQPLNIMLSHCTALHVVISGEKQDAPLPIYRHDTRRRCFPPRRISRLGWRTDESPPSRARASLAFNSNQPQESTIDTTATIRIDQLYLYQLKRRFSYYVFFI